MSNKKIYVELTLGHRATKRDKPTADGYTHDWEVYVRSDQGQIQAFVDRVIFHLHETFPKPRRIIKDPPFSVKESGYAGFMIEIEILFKNKEDPRKAEFKYDLYLQSDGPPISPSRKEKLIFNYPSDDFAKKLFKGGGVVHKEKETNRVESISSNSSSYLSPHSGGKSSKHASTNPAKASPKNSFENLFGTPIKRSTGSPSLTTSTVWGSNPNGPSKDSRTGSSGKGAKGEKVFTVQPNGSSGGGKGEKIPPRSSTGDKPKSAASKSPVMPTLLSPSGSEGSSNNKPSSSKSSKSRRSSGEKRSKSDEKIRKMLPPEHCAVPRKSKKLDIFTPSPSSSTSVSIENSTKDSEKPKRKSSKHSKIKNEDDDSYSGTPEIISRKDIKKESAIAVEIKKERAEKSQLSPIISSSSPDASSSSASSDSDLHSDEDEESEAESEQEEMLEKSNKRIAAANSTSSSKRRSSQHRRSESESGSEQSPVTPRSPVSSPASSSASIGAPSPPPLKRRKSSNSSSSRTPDQQHARSQSPMEKPNSSSSVKVKKEERHHKRNEEEKRSRKSRKKSKKHKKKGFEEADHSDSSVSSAHSYASPTTANGISSNGLASPGPAFPIGSGSGTFTHEMGILHALYARINTIVDPEKLQEVVDIVMDSGGQDLWSLESGFSFDFDLCKLNPSTIRKIEEAILD